MNWLRKPWLGPVLIVSVLAAVLISGIAGGTLPAALQALAGAGKGSLALCALLYLASLLTDALSVRSALRAQGFRLSLRDAFVASVKGGFFSGITPGAAGGQPMQIGHLSGKGIPAGAGTSAVMSHFITQQIMLTVLMTLLGIPHLGFALSSVGAHWPVLAFGYVYNIVMVTGVMLICFSRRPVLWLAGRAAALAHRLRLTRDPEGLREKWLQTADAFHRSMLHLKAHPAEMARQLLLGACQLLMQMSILYFACTALGIRSAGYAQILVMALCQHISAAYMPMPGASGAQEGVFGMYFSSLIPGASLLAVMLVWRFMTYYLGLALGACVMVADARRAGARPCRAASRLPAALPGAA